MRGNIVTARASVGLRVQRPTVPASLVEGMSTARPAQPRSGSVQDPDYWWYRVRAQLLEQFFAPHVAQGATCVDVGSADGPSVGWLRERTHLVAVDVDHEALRPGGVCASALAMPFADGSVDIVSALDVIEHFPVERNVVGEFRRVLKPGGTLLVTVPAYQWAWSAFDETAGHYRRYTVRRLRQALRAGGFEPVRTSYAFAGTFPVFAADRLATRWLRRPPERPGSSRLSPRMERALVAMSALDRSVLPHRDLPFGSSVVGVAVRRRVRCEAGADGGQQRCDRDPGVDVRSGL